MKKLDKHNLSKFKSIRRNTETTCKNLQKLYDKYSQQAIHPEMGVYYRMTPELIKRCRAIIDLLDIIVSTEVCTVSEYKCLRLAMAELYAIRDALAEEYEEQKKEHTHQRCGRKHVHQ